MLKVSSAQLSTVAAIELDAFRPLKEVAKLLKCSVQSAHAKIEQLKTRGVIRYIVPLIDTWRLGYTNYSISFAVSTRAAGGREKLVNYLSTVENVCWFSELSGRYQFNVLLLARQASDVRRLLEGIERETPVSIMERAVTARTKFAVLPRRYMGTVAEKSRPVYFSEVSEPVTLDEISQRILAQVGTHPFESGRELARQTGLPQATVARRLAELQESQIIPRFVWAMNLETLGARRQRILLSMNGVEPGTFKRLLDFAAKQPEIINVAECVGSWDYEIACEIIEDSDLIRVIAALQDFLGPKLISTEVISVLKYRKFSMYPVTSANV
jgi:DNA-binding Lrp family transcriptional regulator